MSGLRGVAFAFGLLLPLQSTQGQAVGLQCDPSAMGQTTDDFAYRPRDDRCEGVYVQKVSGTVLTLASLTESFEDFSPGSGADLILRWHRYGTSPVQVRARTITQRLHYRMESARPAGDTAYRWPSNVLQAQAIKRSELGVTASLWQTVAGANRQVYLPLRIGPAPQATDGTRVPASVGIYTLVIYPTATLTQLFLTVAALDSTGQPRTYIKRDEQLACEYCPADQAIPIRVSGLAAPGLYSVEISALLAGGGSSTLKQWLYHAGSPVR